MIVYTFREPAVLNCFCDFDETDVRSFLHFDRFVKNPQIPYTIPAVHYSFAARASNSSDLEQWLCIQRHRFLSKKVSRNLVEESTSALEPPCCGCGIWPVHRKGWLTCFPRSPSGTQGQPKLPFFCFRVPACLERGTDKSPSLAVRQSGARNRVGQLYKCIHWAVKGIEANETEMTKPKGIQAERLMKLQKTEV